MRIADWKRRGVAWILLLAALVGLAGGFVFWWEVIRPGRKPRRANESVELPLTPATSQPWTTEPAFGSLKFAEPVLVIYPPASNGEAWVLERRGTIQAVVRQDNQFHKHTVFDLRENVVSTPDGDNGALGLALHPRFGQAGDPRQRTFFLLYTARQGQRQFNRLSRFELPEPGRPAVPETVLINQLDENEWHDGGTLLFGRDGFLYVSLGDEGYADDHYQNGQRIDRDLFSGVLRLDVDCQGKPISHAPPKQPETGTTAQYFIPDDNPFVGQPGVLEEFFALGLRNPYRMSFDRLTGQLWAGDVGQNLRDEICLVTKGSNHQWSYAEGSIPFDRSYLKGQKPAKYSGEETGPVFEYAHLNGNSCIIGGYVYRGEMYPQLEGLYIYGDNVSGRIWALDYDQKRRKVRSNTELVDLPYSSKSGLASFAEDPDGELLLCILGPFGREDGQVLRLVPTSTRPAPQLPQRLSESGLFTNVQKLTPAVGLIPYEVNVPHWTDGAIARHWMLIPGDGTDPDARQDRILFAAEGPWQFPPGSVFVQHLELPLDQSRPDVRRRLETRVLVRDAQDGVYGFTYRWNEAQDDALLQTTSGRETWQVRDSSGELRSQTWHFPSQAECLACHTLPAGYILGVKTNQLNRQLSSASPAAGRQQLLWLTEHRFFQPDLAPLDPGSLPQLAAVHQADVALETRVRSYLDANCAGCHRPGGTRANFDARFEVPLFEQRLIDGTLQKDWGIADGRVIRPGEAWKSLALLRLLDGAHRMPPVANQERNLEAIDLFSRWIDSLPMPPDGEAESAASADAVPATESNPIPHQPTTGS